MGVLRKVSPVSKIAPKSKISPVSELISVSMKAIVGILGNIDKFLYYKYVQ